MAWGLGFEVDSKTAVEQFTGTSMKGNLQFIRENIEGELPDNFEKDFRRRSYESFKKDLKPIVGVHNLIKKVNVPFCVASSGPLEKIRLNLTLTNLIDKFEKKIFSSYEIGSWKPEPEIYLYAAGKMGFNPKDCIVIEDSIVGVKAAKAGGFDVCALTNKSNRSTFEKLGAHVFFNMEELSSLLKI